MDELLGDWHLSLQNKHMILVFHMNGRFTIDHKIVGNLSNVVTSKGKVSGTTAIDGDQLTLTPDLVEVDDKQWSVGTPVTYTITEKTEDHLILANAVGRTYTWKRTRQKPKAAETAEVGITHKIPVPPVILNLKKTSVYDKDRYLCMDLEIDLKKGVENSADTPYWLHPRIMESILFYLSNQTYDKVKTFEQSQKVVNKLKDLLNPFMDNDIDKLNIKALIVTTKSVVVDDFIALRNPKKEPDPEAGTDAKDPAEESAPPS